VELDYSGNTIEWIDRSTGEIRKAYVFVADQASANCCSPARLRILATVTG